MYNPRILTLIFIIETNGIKGELYVGQGDDGDYGAGESHMCRFIIEDFRLNWKYDEKVIK